MFGSGMNLITTVIGFAMSATFIVFVCTRLICRRVRGVDSRRMFEIESGIDLEPLEYQNAGLEPTVVSAIPTMKFDREAFTSMGDAQCSICLGEYQEKEVLRIMPKCGHHFHLSCIDVWLRKQSTCPVCRLTLRDSLQAKHIRAAAATTTFGMPPTPSVDFPGTLVHGTQHRLLLPVAELSVGNGSNEGEVESIVEHHESAAGEAGTRQ